MIVPRRSRRRRRHASRRRAHRRLSTPAAESDAKSSFAYSFPSSRRTEYTAEPSNPSPAARRTGADSGHLSPSCLDSSRSKPLHLALHLLRPFPSSFEPTLGQISACATAGRHCCCPSSVPLVDVHSPPFLSPIEGCSELPRTLLHLPDPFSLEFGRRNCRERASPLCAAACRCPHVAPRSGPSSCTISVRTEAA